MKLRAGIAVICTVLSACSTMPSPEHAAVTKPYLDQKFDQEREFVVEQNEILNKQLNEAQLNIRVLADTIEQATKQPVNLIPADGTASSKPALPVVVTPQCPQPAAAAPAPANSPNIDGKTIVGQLEWVYLEPPGTSYMARVDSGATTSSLNAHNIEHFERNGKPWVRFSMPHAIDSKEPFLVETPLVRQVLIRQASADRTERRSVVELSIRLGGIRQKAQFTLADRSDMDYPILLGREFLQDVTLIDVGAKFIHPKYIPSKGASKK